MAKTRSMTRKQSHGNASSRKRIKTCNPAWSDLNHDVLFLVMMQLGVIDFVAFSGVCNLWRLFSVSNKKDFMVSKPPMSISISTLGFKKGCYLKDYEGRKFKTILPHCGRRMICVGLTCGYLILLCKKTRDFWLVNPITRHELHFPVGDVPIVTLCIDYDVDRAILVFSPSISRWVFVVFDRFDSKIWFCIDEKREWTYVYTPSHIYDIFAFKGKLYTINYDNSLNEVRLFPTPKVTLLDLTNFLKPSFGHPMFVSSGENLCVIDRFSIYSHKEKKIQEINFSKMEWVPREKKKNNMHFL
ncbi:unnamed protein product [Lactuca virosa]|uniref:F-box domain-containing protein n=1 Tax=Lactuca virosa TaxID=75947 RepID=A0AAU9PJR0_9ASTR|nr:unnamed protein product [Lactuca virosa]